MTRALSVTCSAVALALLVGATAADAKPTVAVLGLEVTSPDSGTVDQQTTAAASNLTVALRDRVRSGTGPYDTAPGSDKELIDLKLLNECSSEAMPCMVKIGGDLGAKFMLYGHVAKQGGGYRVSVTLLNVDAKSKGMSKSYDVPVADLAGGAKAKDTLVWARRIYGELTGETSQGTLVVTISGTDHGTLLVEEKGVWQPKGSITSNQGRAVLPEGKYKIAVESEGFQRFESTVQVTPGGEITVPVTLSPMPHEGGPVETPLGSGSDHVYTGTVSEGSNRTGLKVGAWGTLALGAIAGGVWIYEYTKQSDYAGTTGNVMGTLPAGHSIWDDSACSAKGSLTSTTENNKFIDACNAKSAEKVLIPATFGLAIVSAGLFYLAYRGDGERPPSGAQVGRKHRTKPTIALIPTMTPTGAGATFRLDW